MTKAAMKYTDAMKEAQQLMGQLLPGAERINVAGSLRRRRATVGDIEFVVIPRRGRDLFGTPLGSLLWERLGRLVARGRLLPGRCGGEKYRQYLIPRLNNACLDLFIVQPETWGVLLAIRTGPAAYSKAIVTQRRFGGLLDDDLVVREGRVWRSTDGRHARAPNDFDPTNGKWRLVPTPEESDFLALCGGWLDPSKRGRT